MRSAFGRRAEPERSEGGGARRSVAVPNGEGVASGSATSIFYSTILSCSINAPMQPSWRSGYATNMMDDK